MPNSAEPLPKQGVTPVNPTKKGEAPILYTPPFTLYRLPIKRFQTARWIKTIIQQVPVFCGVFSPVRYFRQSFRQRCGQSRRR